MNGIGTAVVHLVGEQVADGFSHVEKHTLSLVGIGKHRGTRVVKFLVARSAGEQVHRGRPRTASEAQSRDAVVVFPDGPERIGRPGGVLASRERRPIVDVVKLSLIHI